MEFIPYDSFPVIQQQLISIKLDDLKITYEKWIAKAFSDYHICLTPQSLSRFIVKTALGYHWFYIDSAGNNPFLCHADLENLKNEIDECINPRSNYIDPKKFLEISIELKANRMVSACSFLKHIGSEKLAAKISRIEDIEPSKTWINDTVAKLGLSLDLPTLIEEDRYNSASANLLEQFYEMHKDIISKCPPPLLLGADETMLQSLFRNKVISNHKYGPLLKKYIDVPHITCMCAHSADGTALPLYIILPSSIQSLPDELKDFSDSGKAWFATSKSGWMTQDLFLLWSINLINWMTEYRKTLAGNLRNTRSLLILDGHGSRECPLALQILYMNLIDVLVLPAHTTHITQMFDVCLASPLKSTYSKIFDTLLNEVDFTDNSTSKISKIRRCAIAAIISSWSNTCSYVSCSKAASVTGYVPFDKSRVRSSKYVIQRTEEEDREYLEKRARRIRLDINGRIINSPDFIQLINNKIVNHPKFSHLAVKASLQSWSDFVKSCIRDTKNECIFLGRICPFVARDEHFYSFD